MSRHRRQLLRRKLLHRCQLLRRQLLHRQSSVAASSRPNHCSYEDCGATFSLSVARWNGCCIDKRPIPTKKDKLLVRWAQVRKNKSAHDESDEESDDADADNDAEYLGDEDESEEVADDTDDSGGLVFGSDDSD